MSREKILSSPVYWFDKTQNELFRQFHYYMERENINQTQLAERLGITKGRVSQILTGNSNFRMKSLIELGLSIGVIPKINYVSVEDEIRQDESKRVAKENMNIQKQTENYNNLSYFSATRQSILLTSTTTSIGEGLQMSSNKEMDILRKELIDKEVYQLV